MKASTYQIAVFLLIAWLSQSCGDGRIQVEISELASAERYENSRGFMVSPVHSSKGWAHVLDVHVQTTAPHAVEVGTIHAIRTLNQAAGTQILRYAGKVAEKIESDLFSSLDDDQTTIYHTEDWTQITRKRSTTLATTVWENDIRDPQLIIQGDIILNAEHYTYDDAAEYDVEFFLSQREIVDAESVILHELGHLIGLDHVAGSEDPYSVMHEKAVIGKGYTNRELSIGDKERIRVIYGSGRPTRSKESTTQAKPTA